MAFIPLDSNNKTGIRVYKLKVLEELLLAILVRGLVVVCCWKCGGNTGDGNGNGCSDGWS